ncbi:MAG: 16S rRNA (guanine(527)-N(7))-methyltransferase RsmG [Gammaproteobacteria bacterium]|nr:16S rRNA (guanine(527)-N(7))-methyltransferase RsmG [Gammaproteobacteria bacterium]
MQAATAGRQAALEDLRTRARALGVALEPAAAAQLLRLLDELRQWNRAYNLTAITAPAAMVGAHLLDSLAASGALEGMRIADLGTGAGFPGLPLAIVHPDRHFTLIDGTAKKVRFVAHAARTLGLSNVAAVHARAEELRPAQAFDTIVARAVGSLTELATLARPLARPGTLLLAYKGQRPDAELTALPVDWKLLGVRELEVPGLGAERSLVSLEFRPGPAGA